MYREGAILVLREAYWPDVEDRDEREPGNATMRPIAVDVIGPEWLPKSQRMVVHLRDHCRREFNLTRHELALNGVVA